MTKILLPLSLSLFLAAPPDILPEGMKGIAVETRVDAGALAGDYCLRYAVQSGDTLSAIARHRLGDEARWTEIVPLNPGLDANKLSPGQSLWLPPKNATAAAKELVYAYFTARHMRNETIVQFEPGAVVNPMRGSIGVYLVPASQIVAFEAARTTRGPGVGTFVSSGKVQAIEGQAPGRLVPRDDPTHRRNDTVRIEKDAAGKLVLKVTSVAYDKDGKELARKGQTEPPTPPEPKKELLLLLLAFGGGALLLLRARRSRGELALA